MTCINVNACVVGTACRCTNCNISNTFYLQLEISEEKTATEIKKACDGRGNFRYNVWCTKRKLGHTPDPEDLQGNNNEVKRLNIYLYLNTP